jgi:hypothetical protein
VRQRWQILIAIVPACLLCAASTLTFAYPRIESPLTALAAFLGTLGLAWAIRGVSAERRWTVVALLSIGIVVEVWRFGLQLVEWISSQYAMSSAHHPELSTLVLAAWLLLGPLSIGVFHLVKLVRCSLRSPNKSLERTREG